MYDASICINTICMWNQPFFCTTASCISTPRIETTFKQCSATSNQNTSPGPRSGQNSSKPDAFLVVPCGSLWILVELTSAVWEMRWNEKKEQSFIADWMLAFQVQLHCKINSSNFFLSKIRIHKGCDVWLSNGDLRGTCQMILFKLSYFGLEKDLLSRILICGICIAFPLLQVWTGQSSSSSQGHQYTREGVRR